MGGNTTTMGWLHNSNFMEEDENDVDMTAKLLTARHLTSIILQTKTYISSKWFPREKNDVGDALSCKFDCSDINLTHFLQSHYPE